MKKSNSFFISTLILICIGFSCNPYKGFRGVNKKGMKVNKSPSQTLHEDYTKKEKKMKKRYEREMKTRKRKRD